MMKRFSMEGINQFLIEIYNAIRYNWVFLFLGLFFPIILYRLDQGHDIIYNLFLNENGRSGVNLSLNLFAFSLLAYTLWCLPTPAIPLFMHLTGERDWEYRKKVLYAHLLSWYNGNIDTDFLGIPNDKLLKRGPQFPIRYFAIAPLLMLILTVITVVFKLAILTIVLIVIILFTFIIVDKFKDKISKISFVKVIGTTDNSNKYLWRFLIVSLPYLIFISIPMLIDFTDFYLFDKVKFMAAIYILIGYISAFVLYVYFRYLEDWKITDDKPEDKNEKSAEAKSPSVDDAQMNEKAKKELEKERASERRKSLKNRYLDFGYKSSMKRVIIILIILIIGISFFICKNHSGNIYKISPALIITVVCAFYIVIIQLFFVTQLYFCSLTLGQLRIVEISVDKKLNNPNKAKDKFINGLKYNNHLIRSDLVKYKMRRVIGIRAIVIISILFTLYISFFKSCNQRYIRSEPATLKVDIFERKGLAQYFSQWYREKAIDANGETLNIMLVSGQGGGSRAGFWYLMNMSQFDFQTKGKFYNNLFSMSTVSGSSSGAEMYLGVKYIQAYLKLRYLYQIQENQALTSFVSDSLIRLSNDNYTAFSQAVDTVFANVQKSKGPNFLDSFNLFVFETTNIAAQKIYSKNYVSSAIYGLLIGDGITEIGNILMARNRDRNYYFQQEELYGFYNAFACKNNIAKQTTLSDKLDKLLLEMCKAYFLGDYMHLYQNGKVNYPLMLLNTTNVDNGTKAIFSPVPLNDYSLHTDVYGRFRKCDAKAATVLPLVTAVNQSQAFPLINSYNHVFHVGRLGDGGFFENTGTSTTLELYQALKQICVDSGFTNVRFVLINMLNANMERKVVELNISNPSPFSTLSTMINLPFKGHEYFAYRNLLRQVAIESNHNRGAALPKDTVIDVMLTVPYNLNRIMSIETLKSMSKEIKTPELYPHNNLDVAKTAINKILQVDSPAIIIDSLDIPMQ